jgi:hypothetical protein
VSGDARRRVARRSAAALVGAALALTAPALAQDVAEGVVVGRVTAVAWPGQAGLAAALGEAADRAVAFPGVGALPDRPIRHVIAPSRAAFDSITRGRLPLWSEGAAFPDRGLVVLLGTGPPDRLASVLRHELAHLALRWHLRRPAPLWFEEGYAAVAAGEWGRLDALRLNWRVARGTVPDLDELDRALRGPPADAEGAYALATSAVLLLQRWGGERGLTRLIDALRGDAGFESAIRSTYHLTGDDFEARWHRDLRSRYGWLSWASGVGLFWVLAAGLLIALFGLRRRRDRLRRARLDEGWVVPAEEWAGKDTPDAPNA